MKSLTMKIISLLILSAFAFSLPVFAGESEDRNQIESMIEAGEDKEDIREALHDKGYSSPRELDLEYEPDNL